MRHLSRTLLPALALSLACEPSAELGGAPSDDAEVVEIANSSAHDDAVDGVADASWIQAEVLADGRSMLRVLLTDAPLDAEKVFVTFCGLSVEQLAVAPAFGGASGLAEGGAPGAEEGGWKALSVDCQTVDLLELQGGVTEALGVAALPAGQYGQIRLMLTAASLVVAGEEQELFVPSGEASGLKIGNGFTLTAGVATTLTLDFDAEKSVHFAPGKGYIMKPVIALVDEAQHTEDMLDDESSDDEVEDLEDDASEEIEDDDEDDDEVVEISEVTGPPGDQSGARRRRR